MACLGITISKEISKLLSNIDVDGVKEDSSHFHITLLFLGDNFPIKQSVKAIEAILEVAENFKPFTINIDNYNSFPEGDDGFPIICPIECAELQNLNEELKKSFDKNKLEYSKKWKEYRPHITLSYSDKKAEKTNFDPIEFYVSEIIFWAGDNYDSDKFSVIFPLSRAKESKAEKLYSLCGKYLEGVK